MVTLGGLAVTGSTGHLGGRVARLLSAAGVAQRLVVRDPRRAPALAGATVASAAYQDGAAARRALDGVRTLFMVSASEAPDRLDQHRTFIDAAVAAGVIRIVYLSFYGAAQDATFTLARDHWATEQHVRSTGLAYTFVRDNIYLDFLPSMVVDGVIRGPGGDGRVAAVAQDDIAEAVVAVRRAGLAGRRVGHHLHGRRRRRAGRDHRGCAPSHGAPAAYPRRPAIESRITSSRGGYRTHLSERLARAPKNTIVDIGDGVGRGGGRPGSPSRTAGSAGVTSPPTPLRASASLGAPLVPADPHRVRPQRQEV